VLFRSERFVDFDQKWSIFSSLKSHCFVLINDNPTIDLFNVRTVHDRSMTVFDHSRNVFKQKLSWNCYENGQELWTVVMLNAYESPSPIHSNALASMVENIHKILYFGDKNGHEHLNIFPQSEIKRSVIVFCPE